MAIPRLGLVFVALLLVPLARADSMCPDPPTGNLADVCSSDSQGICIGPGLSGLGAYIYKATGGMAMSLVERDTNPQYITPWFDPTSGPSGNSILGYDGSRGPHDRYPSYPDNPAANPSVPGQPEFIDGSMNLFQADNATLFDSSSTGTHPDMIPVAPTNCTVLAATQATCAWDLDLLPDILHVTLNTTMVRQAAHLHLHATNNGGNQTHTFAFRQSLYLSLDQAQNYGSVVSPWVLVPNHGTYDSETRNEREFDSVNFTYVKVWQRQSGPDHCTDAKAYPWWDPAWGGTQPDRVLLINQQSAAPWDYQAKQFSEYGKSSTGMLLLYWGYNHPLTLHPHQSVDLDWWYGRDVPPKLDTHWVDLAFSSDAASTGNDLARFSTVQPGHSVDFPFEINSRGELAHKPKDEQIRITTLNDTLPDGWQAQVLYRNTLTPLPDTLPVHTGEPVQAVLRITAGPGDHDGGVPMTVRVLANALTSDPDLDALRSRLSAQIRATAVVPPSSGLLLVPSDDGPIRIEPGPNGIGNEGIAHFNLTNTGNVREPLNVRLSALAAIGSWSFSFDSPVVSVGPGETVPVRVHIHPPADAAPGRQEMLLQARDTATGQAAQAGFAVRVVDPGHILLVPKAAALPVAPGASRLFQVLAINQGNDAVPVRVQAAPSGLLPPGWSISLATPTGDPLRAGLTPLLVQVRAPPTALEGTRVEVRLAVLDKAGVRLLASTNLVATAGRRVDLKTILPTQALSLRPGEAHSVPVTLENHGNSMQNATVLPIADPPGLLVDRTPTTLALAPGQNGTIQVTITASTDAPAGSFPVGLEVLDPRDAAATPQDHPLDVTIERVRRASVTAEASAPTIRPGALLRVHGLVRNAGNVPEAFALAGIPSGWAAAAPPSLGLMPGQQAPFQWALRIPAEAPLGSYNLTLQAFDAEGLVPDPAPPLVVTVAQPVLSIETLELDGTPTAGHLVAGTVVVANHGNAPAPALNITVAVGGGEAVQRGHLEALAPNRTAQVRFTLLLPAGPADLQAVADAGNATRIAPATATLHVDVAAARASLGAPLSMLALPALAIALALRRRRP